MSILLDKVVDSQQKLAKIDTKMGSLQQKLMNATKKSDSKNIGKIQVRIGKLNKEKVEALKNFNTYKEKNVKNELKNKKQITNELKKQQLLSRKIDFTNTFVDIKEFYGDNNLAIKDNLGEVNLENVNNQLPKDPKFDWKFLLEITIAIASILIGSYLTLYPKK